MINDSIEITTKGNLISFCEYINIEEGVYYSFEIVGVMEINKELYFYGS